MGSSLGNLGATAGATCDAAGATIPTGAHPGRRATRLGLAGGIAMLLASCATNGTTGGPMGGLANPLAGMSNPLARLGTGLRSGLGTIGGATGLARPGQPGAATPGAVVDPFAGQGVRQPDIPAAGAPSASKPAATPPAATPPAATSAVAGKPAAAATTHQVVAGETAWSISRKYGVSVADLAKANTLPEAMTVRTGQVLAIPAHGATPAATVTAPGAGSPTPQPPSASQPLPREATAPAATPTAKPAAPDLGATRTTASRGQFQMPVAGSIVRTYSKGKNEGIDISAPAGTSVKAAAGGTVAAVTRDTDGVPIVVLRHQGDLLTVYAGLDTLNISKGDTIDAGQSIGTSGKAGVVHFEVRQGFESVDPERYLN